MSDTHKAEIVNVEPRELQRMHPLVGAAMAHGKEFDPATMRELLAVQREWEAGEARKAYTRALTSLKRDLPTVLSHDRVVDYTSTSGKRTRYTHTSLAAVMDAITEPLQRFGFSLAWEPAISERAVKVTCRLTHTEGHVEAATLEAPPDTSGNKNPAQAIASTVTLLQRYTALALLGIATADMQEPTGPSEGEDAINPRRNMTAAKALQEAGIGKAAAEKHVGRPVSEWTHADLDKLRVLLGDTKAANATRAPT